MTSGMFFVLSEKAGWNQKRSKNEMAGCPVLYDAVPNHKH